MSFDDFVVFGGRGKEGGLQTVLEKIAWHGSQKDVFNTHLTKKYDSSIKHTKTPIID